MTRGLSGPKLSRSPRPASDPDRRWVFLDVGLFNGLTETIDEAIRYRIEAPGHGFRSRHRTSCMSPGPSCDSADVLYETYQYQLPLDLHVGDHLEIHGTGAYTCSYWRRRFNGLPPGELLPARDGRSGAGVMTGYASFVRSTAPS